MVVFVMALLFYSAPSFLSFLGFASLDDAKVVTEVVRSLIEAVAVVVAGVWTYERFIEDHP